MSVFNELNLNWKGKEYTVPADNMMRLIAKVESTITLNELIEYSSRGAAPLATLSEAYGKILRYAGAKVSDEDIYITIMKGDSGTAATATQTLLLMMQPPKDLIEGGDSGKE